MAEPLDSNTTVRVGLVISVLGLLIASIWWAASLSTKVDAILQLSNGTAARVTATENRLADQETRLRILEEKQKRSAP